MTCKDCIHSERCEALDACFKDIHFEMLVAPGDEEELCVSFKNKADYVEVKHGYWKDRYGNKYANHLYECSVCGEKPLYKFYTNELGQTKTRQALTPACPYCFAKMDGKDNNVPTK